MAYFIGMHFENNPWLDTLYSRTRSPKKINGYPNALNKFESDRMEDKMRNTRTSGCLWICMALSLCFVYRKIYLCGRRFSAISIQKGRLYFHLWRCIVKIMYLLMAFYDIFSCCSNFGIKRNMFWIDLVWICLNKINVFWFGVRRSYSVYILRGKKQLLHIVYRYILDWDRINT